MYVSIYFLKIPLKQFELLLLVLKKNQEIKSDLDIILLEGLL